jgi:hypothetical protein
MPTTNPRITAQKLSIQIAELVWAAMKAINSIDVTALAKVTAQGVAVQSGYSSQKP